MRHPQSSRHDHRGVTKTIIGPFYLEEKTIAYFANGSEYEHYDAKYCARCTHGQGDSSCCPVIDLHFAWNYDACNGDLPDTSAEDRTMYEALDILWPRDKKTGHNRECKMLLPL